METSVVVVVATGTEVGKTHVSCALVRALRRAGATAVGLKPVESGLGTTSQSDAERLAEASDEGLVHEPRYGFSEPVSPHLAARRTGQAIVIDEVSTWVAARRQGVTVVETAGGLLSPLGPGISNLQLAAALSPSHVVLVAGDRLGALHDTSAALAVLRDSTLGTAPVLVVMSASGCGDHSTGTNAEELVTLGLAADVVTFPHAGEGDDQTRRAADAVVRWVLSADLS